MADEEVKGEDTGGGDVENPVPAEPAAAGASASAGGPGGADPGKKWKAIAIAAFLLCAVVLVIVLGVTLGGDSGVEDVSAKGVANEEGTTTTPSTSVPSGTESVGARPIVYQARYLQQNGPIQSRVRIIDPEVASAYTACEEARDDIRNALGHFANKIIMEQSRNNWYENCDPSNPNWQWDYDMHLEEEGEIAFAMPEAAADNSAAETAPAPGAPQADMAGSSDEASKVTEDSFETNNQVEGVDEADVVKSDGVNVYAAYGDLLYAWPAADARDGMSVTKMPYEEIEIDCPYFGGPGMPEPMPVEPGMVVVDVDEAVDIAFEESTETVSVSNPFNDDDAPDSISSGQATSSLSPGGKKRRRRTTQRKGLSIAPDWDCSQPKPRIVSLLLEGSRLTAIVSENTYRGPWFYEEGQEKTQRVIDDSTKLTIRVYDVSNVPTDGSELPLVGEKEVKGDYNSARSIGDNGFVITTSRVNTWVFADDLYRHQTPFCGLSSSEYEEKAAEIALNNIEPFMERLLEELELQLDGTCDNIFRIAAMQSGNTTEDLTNGDMLSQFVQVKSFNMASNFPATKEMSTNVAAAFSSGYLSSVYASQGFASTQSTGNSYNETTGNWEQSTFVLGFDISDVAPKPLAYAEVRGTPLNQYSTDLYDGHLRLVTTERSWWDSDSRTKNKIFILEVPDAEGDKKMALVGESDHLGKPDESVFAVRFIGPKAYVVTFEQIDPFYIYDLSNVTNPQKMGELEIPGFSSYLHPVEMDGVPFMLGVGEHVDVDDGRRTGVKISLFDISDPYNPTESANFVDDGAYSNAGHDFKSFRYLDLTRKLILPKSQYTWTEEGNFDGFAVYDVTANEITPSYEVQHASSYDMYHYCWYDAYMPPRSLVFQSKLTTILSHSVKSTDLSNGADLWNVTLGDGFDNNNCAPYFRPFF